MLGKSDRTPSVSRSDVLVEEGYVMNYPANEPKKIVVEPRARQTSLLSAVRVIKDDLSDNFDVNV